LDCRRKIKGGSVEGFPGISSGFYRVALIRDCCFEDSEDDAQSMLLVSFREAREWRGSKRRAFSHRPARAALVFRIGLVLAVMPAIGSTWCLCCWIVWVCIYSYRTTMNYFRSLRFVPQVFEGLDFTYLASQIWQYIRRCFQFTVSPTLTSLFASPCQFFDLILLRIPALKRANLA
jgi:hypothetical protein